MLKNVHKQENLFPKCHSKPSNIQHKSRKKLFFENYYSESQVLAHLELSIKKSLYNRLYASWREAI